MTRPPKLTSALLAKMTRSIFGEDLASPVLDQLSEFQLNFSSDDFLRIGLAILKLCDEDGTDKLDHYLTAARLDYRNVLYWAEYPALARIQSIERSQPEMARAARAKDRVQYLAWLKK